MTVIAKTPRELSACTPSGSAQSPHNCSKVIPFFPLRYAVAPAEKGGFAYRHPNLERGFPALDSTEYVLRPLRDDDGFLYIHDPDNREQILCFVYRSPDGDTNGGQRRPAQFQRLQLDNEFRPTALVGELLAFPYIPAYDHDPKSVAIWFADTLLSPAKLAAFQGNTNNVRSTLGTEVNLVPWLAAFKDDPSPAASPPVKHTLRVEDVADQQPVGLDGKPVVWSEYPNSGRLPTLADLSMAQGPGSARLAVVLHDPVGLASELNHRIDSVLKQWNAYNENAARLRWVSDVIETLGNNLAREVELEVFNNDVVGSALPPGATGGAANGARDRAYRKGLDAKRDLFRDAVDQKARGAFLEQDAPTVAHYQQQLDAAAADLLPWGQAYAGPGALPVALRELYDWRDARGFVAGRAAVVRTLHGLICSATGTQELARQLPPGGPREGSLLALALLGFPKISAWAAARQVLETTTDQIASKALKDLNAIVKDIKPDAASRQLTALAMLSLMKGQTSMTAQTLWSSRYAALLEVAEGRLASPGQIATRDVPERLRGEAKLTGSINFRPSALAQGAKDQITVIRLVSALEEAEQAEVRELVPRLASRLSLWHGTKLGLGGLSVLASVTNTAAALNQFTAGDQSALVNSLNATGSLLGVGGAGKGLASAVLNRQRDMAALSGKAAEAEALRKLADRADRWAIGLVALASLTFAFKDLIALDKQGQQERAVTAIGVVLQGVSAGVGFAHLGAKMWVQGTTQLARTIAAQALGETVVLGTLGRAAIWFADAPVALILTALQLAYAWNQARADKAKVADWIRQGCLGLAPTMNGAAEQKAYYELFLKPKIDTSYKFGNIVLDGIFPSIGLPRAQRDVAVLLPGWQPQISAYALTQHVAFGLMTENAFSDPAKVEVRGGNGYLRLEAHNLLGNTVVRYWPNGFTQPDLVLEMTN
ncbi:toxin VasX [Achromobacter sp. NPDC058515]|uniref:toxin VasX n=1 Tax=Achromobacter sp. NPDC058515 TaxID=3346533 RepID=UPI00364C0930